MHKFTNKYGVSLKNARVFLLCVFLAMLYVISNIVAASNIKINSDKTLSVEGVKTFPIFNYGLHSDNYPPTNLTPAAGYFLFNAKEWRPTWGPSKNDEKNRPYYEATYPKVYWTAAAMSCSKIIAIDGYADCAVQTLNSTIKNSPNFFGYYQVDEPTRGTYDTLAALQNNYNVIHADDPNHPIIANFDTSGLYSYTGLTMWDFRNATDIFSYDIYSIRNDSIRADFEYRWEAATGNYAFRGGKKPSDFNKPIYTVLQANGRDSIVGPSTTLLTPTLTEFRLEVYTAIALDLQGITFWAYHHCCTKPGAADSDVGMYKNPAFYAGVKKTIEELHSFNNILVLPTVGNSWYQRYDDTTVLLSHPNMTRLVSGVGTMRKLTYILKKDTSISPPRWYLIIVNKDASKLLNVDITVNGLSGTMTAKTLGLETTGSAMAGRTMAVTNGKFTDSFDGYAAHIYQICSDASCTAEPDITPPVISSVAVSSITSAGATITWTTNEASNTQVEYGLTASYGSSTTLSTSLITSHSQTLSGLTASTQYHYRVKSNDSAGNLAVSNDMVFNTAASAPSCTDGIQNGGETGIDCGGGICPACLDTSPPGRLNGQPTGTVSPSITLSLNTDEIATCKYSTTAGTPYDTMTSAATASGTIHSWMLSGLYDGVKNYYVRCKDSVGNVNADDYSIAFTVSSSQNINACQMLYENVHYTIIADPPTAQGTCFTINGNNVTIDGQGHTVKYSRSQNGDGIDNTGGYDNITIKNVAFVQENSSVLNADAIHFEGAMNGNIINNTIRISGGDTSGSGAADGINFKLSSFNSVSGNEIIVSGGNSKGIWLESSNSNSLLNNDIVAAGSLPKTGISGVNIYQSSGNNITGGSIRSPNTYDYILGAAGATNMFRNTNFTALRKVLFRDTNSWFNYNNDIENNIWLKTKLSASTGINRTIFRANRVSYSWNDSSEADVTATYTITGLSPNTKYYVYKNVGGAVTVPYTNTTSSKGVLSAFSISLSGNTEIIVTLEDKDFICDDSQLDIVFVLDTSGSMEEPCGDMHKIDCLKDAAKAIIDSPKLSNSRVGIYTFANFVNREVGLTNVAGNQALLKQHIDDITTSHGGTMAGDALKEALIYINASSEPRKKIIIFLTDGLVNAGHLGTTASIENYVSDNWSNGPIKIYTVGIGNVLGGAMEQMLEKVAQETYGTFYRADANCNGACIENVFISAIESACEYETSGLMVTFYPLSPNDLTIPLGSTGQAVINIKNLRNRREAAEVSVFGLPPKIHNWMWLDGHRYDDKRHNIEIYLGPRETKSVAINVFGGAVTTGGNEKIIARVTALSSGLSNETSKGVSIFPSENGIDAETPEFGWMSYALMALIGAFLLI